MSKTQRKKELAAFEKARSLKMKSAMYGETGDPRDVLESLEIQHYTHGGHSYSLFFTSPGLSTWTPAFTTYALDLTRENMRAVYDGAPGWGWKEGKKRAELVDDKNRFLVVRYEGVVEGGGGEGIAGLSPGDYVGFVSFRFLVEAEFDVLYVYELQLGKHAQRKGLGRHLMTLCDTIALKYDMHYVMLTVLKNNTSALEFYTKNGYIVDPDVCCSPSAEPHEILCKSTSGTRGKAGDSQKQVPAELD